jgi:hypothetical protein
LNAPPRLRAPRQDGAVLAEPRLEEVAGLIAENRSRLSVSSLGIAGIPLPDLRRSSRLDAIAAAQDYLRQAGEPLPSFNPDSLFLAGHQPELFHPGVWVKNFALNRLARQHGATALNLVVDNDTVKSTLLRLPSAEGQPSGLFRLASVPLDRWQGEVPYEERKVLDEAMFASLPQRMAPLIGDWNFKPLLHAFWEEARCQAQRTPLLGERLAAARRAWERRWGCHNLELPISLLCQTPSFAWFACHLLTNLPRFHPIYNEAVHDYRIRYGLRSQNHPVPDLAKDGDWLEVPLWAWQAGASRRGRLFARAVGERVELRAGAEPWPALPRCSTSGAAGLNATAAAWRDLEERGFKIRSRALTNTLYARVFLGDLFIHGIGGGKYDELTDEIIRRFYGFEPPRFLVLSATLLLPLLRFPVDANLCRRLGHELRDLHWNPQRHLADHDGRANTLARQKQTWIERQPQSRPDARARYLSIRELSSQLRQFVAGREGETESARNRCEQQLAANQVLERRDYAFCLFPQILLQEFCTRFL